MACIFWLYGLSGSGKSTLASALHQHLTQRHRSHIKIDGDSVRETLSKDLGYTLEDRAENIRRAAEMAKMVCIQGHIVIASFITPVRALRSLVKYLCEPMSTYFIFVSCSYEKCASRDVKGFYKAAANGDIQDFTGKDSAFEISDDYDLLVDSENQSESDSIATIIDYVNKVLQSHDVFSPE